MTTIHLTSPARPDNGNVEEVSLSVTSKFASRLPTTPSFCHVTLSGLPSELYRAESICKRWVTRGNLRWRGPTSGRPNNSGVGRFVNAAASRRVAYGNLMYLFSRGVETRPRKGVWPNG
jgi:hypothetical protein